MTVSALMPVVYDELLRLARHYLAQERAPQRIQATALVHEAYLRLAKDKKQNWQGRTHFKAIAAIAMRRILFERARAKAAAKRDGSRARVTLHEDLVADDDQPDEILSLDRALTKLGTVTPEHARIVELRFFGGLTVDEPADVLKISPATVKRGWSVAKAWLRREIDRERPNRS